MQGRIVLTDVFQTTSTPNLLGWDGRGKKGGDPDNSALTGASTNIFHKGYLAVCLIITVSTYFHHNFIRIFNL